MRSLVCRALLLSRAATCSTRYRNVAISHVARSGSSVKPMSLDQATRSIALDPAVVQRVVQDAHARFAGHPTREFVPILVEDSARDRLRVTPVRHGRADAAADIRRR